MHEKMESILNNPVTVPLAIGVVSFGSGLGLGFLFGKRRYESTEFVEYEEITVDFDVEEEQEIETVAPPKVIIGPEVAAEKGILTVKDLSALRPEMVTDADDTETEAVEVEEEESIVITHESQDIDWVWEVELEKRDESRPYVLHREEFFANEKNYTQISLTYYVRDDTLADDDNHPIYNVSELVGELTFGHGSGDSELVYIRNNERKAEYEIYQVDAHYMIEILGMEEEREAEASDFRHSALMRFRME